MVTTHGHKFGFYSLFSVGNHLPSLLTFASPVLLTVRLSVSVIPVPPHWCASLGFSCLLCPVKHLLVLNHSFILCPNLSLVFTFANVGWILA